VVVPELERHGRMGRWIVKDPHMSAMLLVRVIEKCSKDRLWVIQHAIAREGLVEDKVGVDRQPSDPSTVLGRPNPPQSTEYGTNTASANRTRDAGHGN
jgi:hypothetical protein